MWSGPSGEAAMTRGDFRQGLAKQGQTLLHLPARSGGGVAARWPEDLRDQRDRKHPVVRRCRTLAGQKLLNQIRHPVDIAGPDRVLAARQFHQTRAPDRARKASTCGDPDMRILAAVKDQSWRRYCRNHRLDVERRDHLHLGFRRHRAGCKAFEPPPPIGETVVFDPGRDESRKRSAAAPAFCPPAGCAEALEPRHRVAEIGETAVQDKRAHTLGVAGRKENRLTSPIRGTQQRRPTAASRIHHRDECRRCAALGSLARSGSARHSGPTHVDQRQSAGKTVQGAEQGGHSPDPRQVSRDSRESRG